MQRSRKLVVSCPVCQQTDQVRTMQVAYPRVAQRVASHQ